jgi:hypothetical protein
MDRSTLSESRSSQGLNTGQKGGRDGSKGDPLNRCEVEFGIWDQDSRKPYPRSLFGGGSSCVVGQVHAVWPVGAGVSLH